MHIVIKIPFRKSLIVIIFIALLITVGYNIAMMIMGSPDGILSPSIVKVQRIIDIVLWSVLAVWFLSLLLYEADLMGHKGLNVVTSIGTLAVMSKAVLSVVSVIFVRPGVWTVVFSVLELMICIGLLVCMVGAWFGSRRKA